MAAGTDGGVGEPEWEGIGRWAVGSRERLGNRASARECSDGNGAGCGLAEGRLFPDWRPWAAEEVEQLEVAEWLMEPSVKREGMGR